MPLNTLGSNRDQLLNLRREDRQRLLDQHILIIDPRRQRPHWFDGRFLAARDLANEQNYFLVRQADLGQAGGAGVVEGLFVTATENPANRSPLLSISEGHGVADNGELVVLREPLQFDPASVPEIQRLDAAFGLEVIPNEPGRTRTGLYIVALRPVEWTANPIAAYPTSLTGDRTIEDGDIIEGTAVALIPFPGANTGDWNRRRAQAAREIFVEGRNRGLVSGALPLAMVALRGNLVEWVDPYLVRRDAGAERPVGMDFGFGARALREAHLVQYDHHLAAALNSSHDQPFPATAWFDALPPAGRLPANSIDPANFTQRFFPPGLTVELAFVPEDELPALIEESLVLPPIDLTLDADALAGIGLLVLAPLARAEFVARRRVLAGRTVGLAHPILELKTSSTPLALLRGLAQPLAFKRLIDAEEDWRALLRQAQANRVLWYVRRRNLPQPANVAGIPVDASPAETSDPRRFGLFISETPFVRERWEKLRALNSPEVDLLARRLSERRFLDKPALLKSLLAKTEPAKDAPAEVAAAEALAAAADPKFGDGLDVVEETNARVAHKLQTDKIAKTGLLPEIDKLVRAVPKENVAELVRDLGKAITEDEPLAEKLAELRKKHLPNP